MSQPLRSIFCSKRRWWETDHQLYGGISWTSRDITRSGILPTVFTRRTESSQALTCGIKGETFASKTPADRLVTALDDGERLYQGYSPLVRHGVAWPGPSLRSATAAGANGLTMFAPSYHVLVAGEGPFSFVNM